MTKLNKPAEFFNIIRSSKLMGSSLDQSEVDGLSAVLDACGKVNWPISFTAYALATAYHETAHTMQPISEYGGNAYFTRMYDITGNRPKLARDNGNTTPGDGPKYKGRGYVQLTWKNNYARAEKELGIKGLVANPDLAKNPQNAALIMTSGMQKGWFTGKSCASYLPTCGLASKAQFVQARRIINGLDKADLIASYALKFQDALKAGDWQ